MPGHTVQSRTTRPRPESGPSPAKAADVSSRVVTEIASKDFMIALLGSILGSCHRIGRRLDDNVATEHAQNRAMPVACRSGSRFVSGIWQTRFFPLAQGDALTRGPLLPREDDALCSRHRPAHHASQWPTTRLKIGSAYGDATGSQLGSTRSAATALMLGKRSPLCARSTCAAPSVASANT